jgi:GT2 family glycosyltransferase
MNTDTILDISVIIPFKDKAAMTLQAVNSLLKYGPKIKEILLVSNNSNDVELDKIKEALLKLPLDTIKLLVYNHPFNYQKINNWAVEKSSGKFILFLNNDTELVEESRGILEKMYAKASLPNVGITGCLLLYGDKKTIQHAGVFLMPKGMADHLYVGKKLSKVRKEGGHTKEFPYSIDEDRQMTSVTGAVNIIERKKFDEVEGFDERFIIGGGDVDLCIRLNKSGNQTWYVAGGHIIHKESQSRAHKPVTYNDFYYSYLSYIQAYDPEVGDPFLPKITREIR